MNKDEIYMGLRTVLSERLLLLHDKPEETIDSTLMALWLAACGFQKSVDAVVKMELPDISDEQVLILNGLVKRRIENTPLAHITGRQGFMGIELLSDRRALIPRKETEILGRKALELSQNIGPAKAKVRIIDVCCGAGNLGLALAYYNTRAEISAADLSPEAVDLTRDNILFLKLGERVHAVQGDLFSAFESEEYYGKTDLIVCNPPYISSAKVPKMTSEISENEPVLAFNGGMLGTKIILKLLVDAPRFLVRGGWLIFEIGVGQGVFIMQLCERSEFFGKVESVSDNEGNIRVILAQRV